MWYFERSQKNSGAVRRLSARHSRWGSPAMGELRRANQGGAEAPSLRSNSFMRVERAARGLAHGLVQLPWPCTAPRQITRPANRRPSGWTCSLPATREGVVLAVSSCILLPS